MKVGFIGVGQMGIHMARNVMQAGFDLVIHDANKDAANPLLERGAKWAASPADVAASCRIVISCLPTPQIVEDVAWARPASRTAGKPETYTST
jgi:3-hydroxyisobutyrate dehydrogenase